MQTKKINDDFISLWCKVSYINTCMLQEEAEEQEDEETKIKLLILLI